MAYDFLQSLLGMFVSFTFSFILVMSVSSKARFSPDQRILMASISTSIIALTIVMSPGTSLHGTHPNISSWFFLPFTVAFVSYFLIEKRLSVWLNQFLSKNSRNKVKKSQ